MPDGSPNDAIEVVHHDGSHTISVRITGSHQFGLKRRILRNGGDEPGRSLTEAHEKPSWRRRLYSRCDIGNDTDLH